MLESDDDGMGVTEYVTGLMTDDVVDCASLTN